MSQQLIRRLQALNEEIEKTVFRWFDPTDFLPVSEKRNPKSREEKEQADRQCHVALLMLYGKKLEVLTDLALSGNGNREEEKKTASLFLKEIGSFSYTSPTDGTTASLAYDVLWLLAGEKADGICKQMGIPVKKDDGPLRPLVYNMGREMAEYSFREGQKEACAAIFRAVADLSRHRCRNVAFHCEVVTRIMDTLVDPDPVTTGIIGRDNEKYFTQEGVSPYDGYFYWYYGNGLKATDRYEEAQQAFATAYGRYRGKEDQLGWIAIKAKYLESVLKLRGPRAEEGKKNLETIIKILEQGRFSQIDPGEREFILGQCRYFYLKYHADRQEMEHMLPQLQKFKEQCKKYDTVPQLPLLKLRLAETFYAAYYLQQGQYLLMAQAGERALQAELPPGTEEILTKRDLYINLIISYSMLNDRERMMALRLSMEEMTGPTGKKTESDYRLALTLQTAEARLGIPQEDRIPIYRRELAEFHQTLRESKEPFPEGKATVCAIWVADVLQILLATTQVSPQEGALYEEILMRLMDFPAPGRNETLATLLSMTLAQIFRIQGKKAAFFQLEKSVSMLLKMDLSLEAWQNLTRVAAFMYRNMGKEKKAADLAQKVFAGMTRTWHRTVSTLNDHRISQQLMYIQNNARWCYTLLVGQATDRELYEKVLQYKNLAALVGRERNRILKNVPVDEELRDRIYFLRDRLAAAELEDSRCDTEKTMALQREMDKLEAEFTERFPVCTQFTPISLGKLIASMEDGTAIAEYFIRYDEKKFENIFPAEKEDSRVVDIFLLVKEMGVGTVRRFTIPKGGELLEKVAGYMELLQDLDSREEDDWIFGKAELYRTLVEPLLPYLKNVQNLYLAPDGELYNIPFECLKAGRAAPFGQQFGITRILCGRDLLFTGSSDTPRKKGFVLGDPDYDGMDREAGDLPFRQTDDDYNTVAYLEYSREEARRVASRLGVRETTGRAATKYAMEEAGHVKVIHLATHGVFDVECQSNALYSSGLLFAGFNQWVRTGAETEEFGNGILTADEISRMDLSATELVVLSACRSGLGDVSYDTVQGLLPAFGAAGVKWVLCFLWPAHDLGSGILLDGFYKALGTGFYTLPQALQWAKGYLASVTVEQLYKEGWITALQGAELFGDDMDPHAKPFQDEAFTEGAVAYLCRAQ